MNIHPSFAARSGKPRVSGDRGALLTALVHLWPYVWPSDRRDLKVRVLVATALLLLAKLTTMAVPFTFKWATDALADPQSAHETSWIGWALAAPVVLTLAYGGTRILMALLTQLRDGLFAKVAMHAVRRLALITFEHMHLLSLRFHLERKTGGLTRVLERGRNAIETIVRMVIIQLFPTIVELALVVGVLLWQFNAYYVAVIVAVVAVYISYTYFATEWRIGIRRKMNDSDTDANVKAINSLLNYETVKYFGAEGRESQRYDRSMARYEDASIKSYVSLAVLNAGQATIFTIGLAIVMVMCVYGIKNGTQTVGDFVMINAMMIQLYQPLNFMGMVYREIKQAVIDIEKMFGILGRDPEIEDKPGAKSLIVSQGAIRFENVSFAYEPARPILKGLSFEVPAGHTVAIVGPSGARQIHNFPAAVPVLRHRCRADPRRRPGHPRRDPGLTARRDRHGSAGHGAVQRQRALQHPLRALGRERCRGRTSRRTGADRHIHPFDPERLRDGGRRTWPEAVRRREAAGRHRAHHPQGAADPVAR